MTDPYQEKEFKQYLVSASGIKKVTVTKLIRSYAFHNVLDMMVEDEVAQL